MKNVIIVPSWIQRVLAREHLAVKDVLCYSKVSELLAPADIRALNLIQSYGPFCEYHITETDSTALLKAWRSGLSQDQVIALDEVLDPGVNHQIDKDHLKFLIQGESRASGSEKGFEVIPGDANNILLVLKDGYFGSEDYNNQDINIVENILRVLYGEFVPEQVARTSISRRYVKALSCQTA
jgi:hypothetical protein